MDFKYNKKILIISKEKQMNYLAVININESMFKNKIRFLA